MHIPFASYFSDQHIIPALSLFPSVFSHPLLGSWAWWMAPHIEAPLSILTGSVLRDCGPLQVKNYYIYAPLPQIKLFF